MEVHELPEPLLLLACPGTRKTTTLVRRINLLSAQPAYEVRVQCASHL